MRTALLAAAGVGTMILLPHGFAVEAAEVRVKAVAAMTAVFKEIGPHFERDTGHKLVISFAPTPVIKREIDAGETFDLVISISSAIDDWIREGKIVGGTRTAVAYAGVGVGVRMGAPKPDFSSVEASRRALLNAKSVAHGAEGASAAYFKGLIERLGIAEEMKPKLKPMATIAGLKSVASGELELVIAAVPTIVAAPGVELVGPFPSELQTYIVFVAGVGSGTKEPDAAQSVIKFLTSPETVAVIKAKGLEPGTPR